MRKRSLGRTCGSCPAPIYDDSTTGYCRRCNFAHINSDPRVIQKRNEAIRRRIATDPRYRATLASSAAKARAAAREKPEFMAFLAASGKRFQAMRTPETEARRLAALAEANRRRAIKPWLPEEYREEYHRLTRVKCIRVAEAKRIILAEIAAKEARLSPFERQQRALERGGKLVANDAAPTLDRPGQYGEARWTYGKANG